MLLLSFYIGSERYSILAKDIVEILPLVQLKKIPKAPDYILGLIDYRGTPSPVIDLCNLIESRDCKKVLSSRIIMINYVDAKKQTHIVGITAEKVTETININKNDFHASGITLEETRFLGEIAKTKQGVIQYIEIKNILPRKIQLMLFQDKTSSFETGL